jgi:hypothetical protein
MRVLGIHAVFHDPAAALVVDGEISAAEEGRFRRRKHGKVPVPFSTWELPEGLRTLYARRAPLFLKTALPGLDPSERTEIPVGRVTHFNDLFLDTSSARTYVVEHGVVDPGARYTGELPREVGLLSTSVDALARAVRDRMRDPARARAMGEAARAHALERYGLGRFLADRDAVLAEVTR